MIEHLINFDTAKLAKQKGFNITNKNSYDENTGLMLPLEQYGHCYALEGTCPAPTQSLLQKWLRENHNVEVMTKSWKEGCSIVYLYSAHKIGEQSSYMNKNNFKTFEEALDQGLFEALKLIKSV